MPNNFSGDSTCVALWRFEPGALTADSKGTNTLTASASPPVSDTTEYREGTGSARYYRADSQYHRIADSALASGFPLKSGDTTKKISVAYWYHRRERASINSGVFTKYDSSVGKRGLFLGITTTTLAYLIWGYNNGASAYTWAPDAISYGYEGYDYHLTWIIDGVAKTAKLVMWSEYSQLEYIRSTTFPDQLSVNDVAVLIGAVNDGNKTGFLDKNLDEMVVFNRLLSEEEATQIRLGLFGSQGISPVGIPSEEAVGTIATLDLVGIEAAKCHGAHPVPIFTFYLDQGVTSWKSPGTCTNEDRDGGEAWATPDNAKALDTDYAICSVAAESYGDWLRLTNFDFSEIPDGATIQGIEIKCSRKRYESTGASVLDIQDSALYARKTSGQVGSNLAVTDYWPVGEELKYYGGASNLLDAAWTVAEIKSADFGFDLSVSNSFALSVDAMVNLFQVRVYYGPAGADYEVPSADISNAGTLNWSKARDFSDLNPSDHTLTLFNPTGKYTPGNANFVFADDPQYYYRRRLKIELGFYKTTTQIVKKLIFRGAIQEWGPTVFAAYDDQEAPTVEVYTQDLISVLLDQTILGKPTDEGDPRPLVYGQIMASADSLEDRNPDTPAKEAYFEGGVTDGDSDSFDSVIETNGTVDIDTTNPYAGTYCALATVNAASAVAYGVYALAAPSDIIQIQFKMRLHDMPETPDNNNMTFLELLDSGNNVRLHLHVTNSTYQVQVHAEHTDSVINKDLDWWLNSYQDTYATVSVLWNATEGNHGWVKIFVENAEVWNWEPAFDLFGNMQTFKIGVATDTVSENWSMFIDNVRLWSTAYRYTYQIPGGGAYQSIDGAWVDGGIVHYDTADLTKKQKRRYNRRHWLTKRYGRAKRPNSDIVTYHPEFGGVGFSVDVNGDIFIMATRNTITHPVDVLTALFQEAGLDSYLNTAVFAAAKTATSGYQVGCIFDNVSALDAVTEVASKCLYDLPLQLPVRLIPYAGTPPASVVTLTDGEMITVESTDLPRDITNQVTTKYGWYEHDDRSFVKVRDETSIGFVGEKPDEYSLEWGESVATNLRSMAEDVTDLLLTRLGMAPRQVKVTGRLDLAFLLLGQGVTIESNSLDRPSEVFELMELQIDLQEWRTELQLQSFAIPAAPA